MIRLLTDSLWNCLTQYSKAASKAFVATAYVGKGATRLLPLRKGSTLVVDLGESSVKAGMTNPHEILKFIKSGVRVHSVENLHAKVFVFQRRAVIGSSNASRRSANTLVEAALETTDPSAVRAAREFVRSLTGDPIGPEYCKSMIKLYKPPKWSSFPRKTKRRRQSGPFAARKSIWVVPLVRVTWDKVEQWEAKQGRKAAKKRIKDASFLLDEFVCPVGGFRRIERGDRLLQSMEERRDHMLSFPGKVVHVREFDNEGQKERCVYIEVPSAKKRRRLSKSRTALGRNLTSRLLSSEKAFCIRDLASIESIEELWT